MENDLYSMLIVTIGKALPELPFNALDKLAVKILDNLNSLILHKKIERLKKEEIAA